MTISFTCVDLFSGCGGLSLGLRSSGFKVQLAVEKSDMAAETYYHNFIERIRHEDIWRQEFLNFEIALQARKGLVVKELAKLLATTDVMDALEAEGIDLVAGGPPCQGFSTAGLRNPDDIRNQLPWQFLEFVEKVRPRAVIIENVSGMRSHFTKHSKKSRFEELGEQLSQTGPGYVVQPMLLNARHFGVAQNRPRLFLVAISLDVATALSGNFKGKAKSAVLPLWESAWDAPGMKQAQLTWEEPTGMFHNERRKERVRPYLVPARTHFHQPGLSEKLERTVSAALAGLSGPAAAENFEATDYGSELASLGALLCEQPKKTQTNHGFRKHSARVKRRFGFYRWAADHEIPRQILSLPTLSNLSAVEIDAEIRSVIKGKAHYPAVVLDGDAPTRKTWIFYDENDVVDAVWELATKKHSQRALRNEEPAPTVVSLPDDFVHPTECRVPTVRELARFQSFPDAFEFRAKETTGAHRRRFEVPQYTQVGNAVPPLLAQALGRHLHAILSRVPTVREILPAEADAVA